MRERRIAVIGGGLAGLAAAYALEQRGANVVVYEAEERLGGRATTDVIDGVSVDPGAQLFGSMYSRFLDLVRSIGLGERLVRVPGRDALWRDGRAHEVVYGSVASMVASGGLPLMTKMRLGAAYVPFLSRHGQDLEVHAPERAAVAGLDRESIAEWGRREIDEAFVRSLVYPQLAAYYGAAPGETSAGFYHILARHGLDVELYGLDGGVGQIADRLANRVADTGGEVRTGAPVREIVIADDRVRVITDAGEDLFYGAVSAVPAPVLASVLHGAPDSLTEWLAAVRYRPALSLALILDRQTEQRFFGLSFPQNTHEFVAAVAVQENKGVPVSDTERGVLIAFPTPESVPELIEMESREILDRMLPEIAIAFPGIEDRVIRARAYRWPAGSPVMYPGYLAHLGRFRAGGLESGAPLSMAGDYLYGPSVEGAVVSGFEAAERLAERISPPGTS
jgi:oxygen-dependent protoporphyrinogen oxidase